MPAAYYSFRSRSIYLAAFALLVLTALFPVASRAAGREIYPAPEQGSADLAAAIKAARAQHKRLIIDFGGNWCGDCQVLDIYFHDPINKQLLDGNYLLVDINIGRQDRNLEIAERYGVDVRTGVPALVVLDEHGRLLYSQRNGEFKSMRHMDISSVTSFLLQWKPASTHPGL